MSQRPRITILHIDDTETNRYIVSRILHNVGFNVIEATSGSEGLKVLQAEHPDLIILDVKLPDIDGFEICQRIKANPATATIPILFLSANCVRTEDKAYGLESGADAYLIQPVEAIELVATIRALWRLRQAEAAALTLSQEWQTTFDAMSDGVCLLDQSGCILRCNCTLFTMVEAPETALLGNSYQVIPQLLTGSGEMRLFQHVQTSGQRASEELQAIDRWFSLSLDPVFNTEHQFTGAVVILTDITARKQATAERERLLALEKAARHEAETANRLKDEFLATLSHELRSPLNALLGWVRLLNNGQLEPAITHRALETIERNARAQAQLVEDLLDVSRIIQGKLRLKIRPLDLSSVIRSVVETVQPAADAKNIHLDLKLDPTVGLVPGDGDRLQQVFWNLLANAVKFTPNGGWIEVKLERQEGAGNRQATGKQQEKSLENNSDLLPSAITPPSALITVTDTGKGIPTDFLPYVFERFRQADGSITRTYTGLGLGLAIVRHLVELHGGTVWAASPGEGQGATFTVELPLAIEAKLAPPAGLASPQPLSPSASYPLRGIRVLVVDNEPDDREFLSLGIGSYGAEVITAASVAEALKMLVETAPNVLVSDIGMPGEDGYSLISKVRSLSGKQGGETPAIALTAYASGEDQQRAIAAGFQLHLSKPVNLEQLIEQIARLSQRYPVPF